jgi:hypothetical protein
LNNDDDDDDDDDNNNNVCWLRNQKTDAKFQVLTAVLLKLQVFWYNTL